MNNQTFNIHWRIAEDYPTADGEYLVCFLLRDGSYGNPEFMNFSRGEWEWGDVGEFPAFWSYIPMPIS